MKKLIATALVAVIGMTAFAQEKTERPEKKERRERPDRNQMVKFTPEQRRELMLKKMTLELDLNANQQKEMGKLIADQSTKREAFIKKRKEKTEKPTTDEIFAMKSKMLDEQIAMKAKMKKILSPEQFTKWEARKKHHREDFKKHFKHRIAQNTHHRKNGEFKKAYSHSLKKDIPVEKEETK